MIDNNSQNAKRYNLYNFEANFRSYLLAGNSRANANELGSRSAGQMTANSVKNYLSDFRHFCGFAMRQSPLTIIASAIQRDDGPHEKVKQSPEDDRAELIKLLTPEFIGSYKQYLVDSNLPRLTVNRRLSTTRKFCTFCISQGWMKENPSKRVSNIASTDKEHVIASAMPAGRQEAKQSLEGIAASPKAPRNGNPSDDDLLNFVFEYENALSEKEVDKKQLKKELGNINEFLSIISAL